EKPNRRPDETVFVGPVLYRETDAVRRHQLALDEAAAIFLAAANKNPALMQDRSIGIPFMQAMAREGVASPLIWNCLTSKNSAYEHEEEVRLIMLGLRKELMPYIKTRLRGSEIVPYVPHQMPIREQNIVQIIVGPAATGEAEEGLRVMLNSLG